VPDDRDAARPTGLDRPVQLVDRRLFETKRLVLVYHDLAPLRLPRPPYRGSRSGAMVSSASTTGGATPTSIVRATTPEVPEPAAGTWSNCLVVGGEKDDALADVVGHGEPADRVPRHSLLPHRIDIIGAEIVRAADKGLLAHVGLNQTRVDRADQCRFDYTLPP
jgi:hypothetical protein